LDKIEVIEKRLWSSADNLRANSNYASNEYFLPVMGLIFLRHAYSRFERIKIEIEASLPSRGGKVCPLGKTDFSGKGAIYLGPEAQFDFMVELPDSKDRAHAIIHAMQSIEEDYETLKGVLPKAEYQELDNDVLGQLLRTFNDPALKAASGDVFGRIYEYFLTGFADQKAHDGGEFFTPVSLVQMIVNIIEPDHGSVLDPACGSGGMFVQSAHFIEQLHKNPTEAATFYGMEKNPTTIRLAKMNLAVHGLEGNIQKAISYYEEPHNLVGKANFVMANPPFNVDEVDAGKVKNDPRLPFGLPGVNKKEKVSNGNYLWISYFHSYLNDKGRAGFVMSSQASSSGRDEAKVRRKLIETGDVDAMISIRGNFFYTRSVPCELWFLNKDKPDHLKDKLLMIDARHIYRKVTRKIFDFSPEQLANLTSIVWLYRGETQRFLELEASHLDKTLAEAMAVNAPLLRFFDEADALFGKRTSFLGAQPADGLHAKLESEIATVLEALTPTSRSMQQDTVEASAAWKQTEHNNEGLHQAAAQIAPLAESARDIIKDIDHICKLLGRLIDLCEQELDAKVSDLWSTREISKARKALDEARKEVVEQLKQVRYFFRQAQWLQERFPDAELCDVPGLVKLVDRSELAGHDYSLTPGRYVGVAPEEVDENFDFEEALRDIHIEMKGLNDEAAQLATKIARNFEELGI